MLQTHRAVCKKVVMTEYCCEANTGVLGLVISIKVLMVYTS